MTLEMILSAQVVKLNQEKAELLNVLKKVIEDLELRARVHKTLADEEVVDTMSDSCYRKAKEVIAKFEMVE